MGTAALWVGFNLAVVALLSLDLLTFRGPPRPVSLKEAAAWTALWVTLSLAFDLWILRAHGATSALEFLTGYVLEKSLSVDNIFVFLLVFRALGIAPQFQHRVLFWGVFGALVLRGLLIAASSSLIARFGWILYLFGAFLVIAGVRILFRKHRDLHPERNPLIRWAERLFPMAQRDSGDKFWTVENGKLAITPLLLALIVVESMDVIFAMDSVPAVFGITRDPFVVYSSNVCAILGLRAMYFLLAGVLPLFRFLEAGVSAVLVFIGAKMLAEPWIHISTSASLATVAAILVVAVVASFIAGRPSGAAHA